MKLRIRQIIYIFFAVAAFVLLIFVVTNSQSPESLMNPPEAAGDYKDIQNVIENTLSGGIILKAPNEGDYTTAITFSDLNSDGENDAVAFYRLKNDDTSSIYMSVLMKNGSKWIASEPVKGKGNDVLEFSVGDLNYDSIPEIVVGWNMFDSKDNNTLSVYSVSAERKATVVTADDSLIYTKMFVSEVCDDGKKEILLIKNTYNDESAPATAAVYELEDGKLKKISSANMIDKVSEYKKIQTREIASKNVYYLDGVIDATNMVTEILYWNEPEQKLVNPIYERAESIVTYRTGTVPSTDINADGIIEIPFSGEQYSEKYVPVTDWKQFEFDGFRSVCQGICSDELIFNFPDNWNNRIAVEQKGKIWSFYDIDGEQPIKLFDLAVCDLSGWQTFSKDYDKIKIDYGMIYGVKLISSNSELALTKNEIKNAIINIR